MINSGRWALAACSKMGRMLWTSKYFPRFDTGGAFPSCSGPQKKLGSLCPSVWWIYPLMVMLNAPWGPVQTRSSCRKSKPMAWTARISAPEAGNLWLLPIRGVMCRPSVHQPPGGKRWETNNFQIQLDHLRNLGHTDLFGMHTWRHIYMPDLSSATAQPIQLNAAATPWCLWWSMVRCILCRSSFPGGSNLRHPKHWHRISKNFHLQVVT